jgi:hypothetical protein
MCKNILLILACVIEACNVVLNFLNFYTILQDLLSFRTCLKKKKKYSLMRTVCCLAVCVCPVEFLDRWACSSDIWYGR